MVNIENEIWKDIKGYKGLYQVSNLGNVKYLPKYHTKQEGIMKYTLRSGYRCVNLRKNGTRTSKQIHRLVAEAFIPNPECKKIVNHKDFDRQNNKVDNLEWCSQKENVRLSSCNMKGKVKIFNGKENYGISKKHGKYEVTIKRKYYGRYSDKEEAKKERDKILLELGIEL